MNEHDVIRSLLPLAASGDLSPDELRRVQEHLARCETCRRLDEEFSSLTGALRDIPTPQPPAELVARVRVLAGSQLARRRAGIRDWGALMPLVFAGWIVALATWPLVREAVRWMLAGWQLPAGGLATALAGYSLAGLLVACVSAFAVGRHARTARRIR